MAYLFLLKRFEIWLLLGVVTALLVFAFQPIEEDAVSDTGVDGGMVEVTLDPAGESDEPEVAAPEPEPLVVEQVNVEQTEQGQVVEITLLARSRSEEAIEVSEATMKASTGNGMPVPHFFAPFRPTQRVGPGEPSLVTVKFWLAEAAESIWVDFQGDRAKAELPGES